LLYSLSTIFCRADQYHDTGPGQALSWRRRTTASYFPPCLDPEIAMNMTRAITRTVYWSTVLGTLVLAPQATCAQEVERTRLHVEGATLELPLRWIGQPAVIENAEVMAFTAHEGSAKRVVLVGTDQEGDVAFAKSIALTGGDLEPFAFFMHQGVPYLAARATRNEVTYALLARFDAEWNVLWTKMVLHGGDASVGLDHLGAVPVPGGGAMVHTWGAAIRFDEMGSVDLAIEAAGLKHVALRTDGRIMVVHEAGLTELATNGAVIWNEPHPFNPGYTRVVPTEDGGCVAVLYGLGLSSDGWIFQRYDAQDSVLLSTTLSHAPSWFHVGHIALQPSGALRIGGVYAANGSSPTPKALILNEDGAVEQVVRPGAESAVRAVLCVQLSNGRSAYVFNNSTGSDPVMVRAAGTNFTLPCEGFGAATISHWTELVVAQPPRDDQAPVTSFVPDVLSDAALVVSDAIVLQEQLCGGDVGIDQPVRDRSDSYVYPMPASDQVQVMPAGVLLPVERIRVFSTTGNLLFSGPYGHGIDVRSFPEGMYLIELPDGARMKCLVLR
jgi:hypothetical protein